LQQYNAIQLKWDSKTKINDNYPSKNFGDSKGMEFNRAIIYPTKIL
jgi:hypothetical protein